MNNYIELAKQCPNVTISLKAGELIEAIDYCVEKTRKELELKIEKEKSECYLTPDEVCEKLSVSRPTLWRWNKEKFLTGIRVGGKVKYQNSKIEQLLKAEV